MIQMHKEASMGSPDRGSATPKTLLKKVRVILYLCVGDAV
jgi:hypothetical protein